MKQVICFLVFTLLSFLTLLPQSDFSQWRGPMRNGYYPGPQLMKSWPTKGPELVWKFEGVGSGYSSPAIVGDKIIVTGTLDSLSYVFCFSNVGKLLWKGLLGPDFKGEYPGIYSTPVIISDLGYVISSLGVLYCFSSGTG